mgnify:CR=1 FL=1
MKYVSIDIETSGLDYENNKVLSIGAIVEDTKLKLPFSDIPKFNAIVLQRQITGSPRAIIMNKEIIEMMGAYLEGDDETKRILRNKPGYQFFEEDEVIKELYKFLLVHHENKSPNDCPITSNSKYLLINVAGKNFGTFDQMFLKQLPWWQKLIRVKQRIIDPAVLCCKWDEDGELPNLRTCKERLQIEGIVTHTALDDAWDVITVLRKFY